MNKKLLIKLGAPILAFSLVAACGTGDQQQQPQQPPEEAPLNQEDGGMQQPNQ
ncbi:hypothetical protein [Oceanobacillus saliphilus]|uniref:hypothetical protein n=1 Tax=Oceanobacillus saliphilus TaxID=2925834 RepID=UPI00201DD185|nr:hypothetical protein [Oceanobacillus saliphilus]